MTSESPHEDPYAVHSIALDAGGDAVAGRVVWAPAASLWQTTMLAGALAAPLFFSWNALLVFVVLTGATLLVGHSVGFHRRLIHGSFQSPPWLDRVMMYLGTLVGMSGPLAMIEGHDLRDWGQRQPACHPYLSNRAGVWTDYAWNLHGRLVLAAPPRVEIPARIAGDRFYRFLERTWMLQQLPVAIVLFVAGGWSWLLWGVCARVCVSVTGHWFVGRLAHRAGPQRWLVEASGIQAHDVPWAAIPTMGEAWHNNHHAWPGSAKLGLYPGQADLGFAFIRLLERLGLAWDVRTPDTLPERVGLARV
jgi:stearoyl-CoA desaturase (delta-9 desaturase)